MAKNLLVGSHKTSKAVEGRWQETFNDPYQFDICRSCCRHKHNGGSGKCGSCPMMS